jgi:hypothetical protein
MSVRMRMPRWDAEALRVALDLDLAGHGMVLDAIIAHQ